MDTLCKYVSDKERAINQETVACSIHCWQMGYT